MEERGTSENEGGADRTAGRIAPDMRTEETGGAWSALHQLETGPEVNKNDAS
jgi:hypothetical protein